MIAAALATAALAVVAWRGLPTLPRPWVYGICAAGLGAVWL